MTSAIERKRLAKARRVVVKIGSRTIAQDRTVHARLARTVSDVKERGQNIVIVSSGAIALGMGKLGFATRPKEIAKLQAAAAAGQSLLMRAYEEAFEAHGVAVAQVLLTHADLAHRTRSNNAREALNALLEAGAVPILNENDSVAVDEIKFGDNDQLAAHLVPLVDADLVVLLSDVEGLLDGASKRVPIVHDIPGEAMPLIKRSKSTLGSGGMSSKVEAAHRATIAGAAVVIADGRDDDALRAVLAGDDVGTLFVPSTEKLSARKFWIRFTLRPRGDLVLDRGATEAVRTKKTSVLAVGVLGIRGSFRAGDSIRLLDASGDEIARGLARCAAVDALSLAGKSKRELSELLADHAVIVHRDDLVLV